MTLNPPDASEGVSLEGLEKYWNARGYTIEWKMPQPAHAKPRASKEGIPTKECPGCLKQVPRDDVWWRRARMPMGRLGRFVTMCRSCEDHAHGWACPECHRHRPRSSYTVLGEMKDGRTNRARICVVCRRKPPKERVIQCSKCGCDTTRAESPKKVCKACRSKEAPAQRAAKPKECRKCGEMRPRSAFAPSPSGRLGWYCRTCRDTAAAQTEQQCIRCKRVKPMDGFPSLPGSLTGKREVCRPCYSVVTLRKRASRRE